MPSTPRGPYDRRGEAPAGEEYRRVRSAKARRRKKRQTQRLLLIAAFVLAAVLLVLGIVAIFRAILGGKKPVSSSSSTVSVSVVEPISFPTSGPGISWRVAPDTSVWNLLLVNGQHPVPEGWGLTTEQIASIVYGAVPYYFDARIIDDLNAMINDCNAVPGNSLKVISGMRGKDNQNERYNYLIEYFKGQGRSQDEAEVMARQIDPPAGYSEHEIGLAVDFITGTVQEPAQAFADTPDFKWLAENAHLYGFILRYPSEKERITGIIVQPYHFRYVGKEAALVMFEDGTCLEEYLAATPDEDDSVPVSSDVSVSGSIPGEDPGAAATE